MKNCKSLLLLLLLFSTLHMSSHERKSLIKSAKIDSTFTVEIGGIKQYLQIKSMDTSMPILLFLAGGPGGSMMNSDSKKFTSKLKDYFTIVQWDQRDAGKTLALNPSTTPISLAQMQTDTYEVICFLLKHLNKKKLYLAGYSFGNVLGFNMVDKHPELLNAYLAINPVVNQLESEKLLLIKLKEVYHDNPEAIKELTAVKIPFERTQDLYLIRKWLFDMDGKNYATTNKFRYFFMDWAKKWFGPWQELMAIDLTKSLLKVDCPIYFFVGKDDIQTCTSVTQNYFNLLQAPKKEWFLFENSKHSVFETESEKFQNIIIQQISSVDFPK